MHAVLGGKQQETFVLFLRNFVLLSCCNVCAGNLSWSDVVTGNECIYLQLILLVLLRMFWEVFGLFPRGFYYALLSSSPK